MLSPRSMGRAGKFALAESWLSTRGGTGHGWASLSRIAAQRGDFIVADRCATHVGDTRDRGFLLLDLALLARRRQHFVDEKSFLNRSIKELERSENEGAIIDRVAARLLSGDKQAFDQAIAWLGQFRPEQKEGRNSFAESLADRWLECGLLDAAVQFVQKAGFPDGVRDVPEKIVLRLSKRDGPPTRIGFSNSLRQTIARSGEMRSSWRWLARPFPAKSQATRANMPV